MWSWLFAYIFMDLHMRWLLRRTCLILLQHPEECCTAEMLHEQQDAHALVCSRHTGFRMVTGILFVNRDELVFAPLQRPRCTQPLRYCVDSQTRVFLDDSGYTLLFRISIRKPPPRVCVRTKEAAFSFYVPEPEVVCAKLNELLAANRTEGTQGE